MRARPTLYALCCCCCLPQVSKFCNEIALVLSVLRWKAEISITRNLLRNLNQEKNPVNDKKRKVSLLKNA